MESTLLQQTWIRKLLPIVCHTTHFLLSDTSSCSPNNTKPWTFHSPSAITRVNIPVCKPVLMHAFPPFICLRVLALHLSQFSADKRRVTSKQFIWNRQTVLSQTRLIWRSSINKLVSGYSLNEVLQLCLPVSAYHNLLIGTKNN